MPRVYELPTHLGVEDQLIAGLTARQLLRLVIGASLAYGVWDQVPWLPEEVRLAVAIVLAIIGVLFAAPPAWRLRAGSVAAGWAALRCAAAPSGLATRHCVAPPAARRAGRLGGARAAPEWLALTCDQTLTSRSRGHRSICGSSGSVQGHDTRAAEWDPERGWVEHSCNERTRERSVMSPVLRRSPLLLTEAIRLRSKPLSPAIRPGRGFDRERCGPDSSRPGCAGGRRGLLRETRANNMR